MSRNSTLRGCPSKLLAAESDSLSQNSTPAAQKELSFRHHKRHTSRAGYGIPPSEDNKLWLSREFPEIAIRQNESKLQTSRNGSTKTASNSTSVKRRVSRVESLRNLFFNRNSSSNAQGNGAASNNGGAAAKRRFLLKQRARSAEKDALSTRTTQKVCLLVTKF